MKKIKNWKIQNLEKLINDRNLWIKDYDNIFYLTGFKSSNLNLFYIDKVWYALTDGRYFEAVKQKLTNFIVLDISDQPFQKIILPELLKEKSSSNLFVDYKYLNSEEKTFFEDKYPQIKLQNFKIDSLRMIKSDEEISKIKKACQITDQIFTQILSFINPGVSEIEIDKELKKIIIEKSDGWSFEPIVAAGKNSSNPHHQPTNYKLVNGDVLTLDFGVFYEGYCSDVTRTFAVGDKLVDSEIEKIHSLVLRALENTLKMIKPGILFSDLEKSVRAFFKKNGYEKYFNHSLGHGIGINVHELPNVTLNSEQAIEKGMIFTIEPGIYIPGKYGCRIEQNILINGKNCLELNKTLKLLYF